MTAWEDMVRAVDAHRAANPQPRIAWDTCEQMPIAEALSLGRFLLAQPRPRAIPVRHSFYSAHRRRWLAHLLSLGLGYRSPIPPMGVVA